MATREFWRFGVGVAVVDVEAAVASQARPLYEFLSYSQPRARLLVRQVSGDHGLRPPPPDTIGGVRGDVEWGPCRRGC